MLLPFTVPPTEKTRGWKGKLLLGGWRTFTRQDRVVIVHREARGTGILAGKGDDREIILGVGYPRGLGSDDGDDLDVIAPPGLVAKGFEREAVSGPTNESR
jgi:hypothetical protein